MSEVAVGFGKGLGSGFEVLQTILVGVGLFTVVGVTTLILLLTINLNKKKPNDIKELE
tara:strand:- start:180 stop:353 length:174 start_codon:yes stop_codon:yes gene_type:complete